MPKKVVDFASQKTEVLNLKQKFLNLKEAIFNLQPSYPQDDRRKMKM